MIGSSLGNYFIFETLDDDAISEVWGFKVSREKVISGAFHKKYKFDTHKKSTNALVRNRHKHVQTI